jgi:endonuclease G
MKQFLTILTIITISIFLIGSTTDSKVNVTSQDTKDTLWLKHTNYLSIFSKSKRYPVMIEWWVTKAKVTCKNPLKRKDNFKPDPLSPTITNLINDYKGSGYDRGHMMPAADNLCQTQLVQDECFYFSNMIPQPHTLNAGSWKTLETETRLLSSQEDSIHVWCGGVGSVKTFGPNKVAVPVKCWKVIYIKKTKEYRAYIFPNNTDKTELSKLKTSKEEVEKLSGFKFD